MELNSLFLISMPGGGELVIIVLVVVLLFGGRKIPELMKGLGEGMREFRKAKDGDTPSSSDNKSDKGAINNK